MLLQVKDRPFSFQSAKTLRSHIELLPDAGAQWKSLNVIPHSGTLKKPTDLLFRDPLTIIQQLLQEPIAEGDAVFSPCKAWEDESRTSRQFSEMHTGKYWWDEQVRDHS